MNEVELKRIPGTRDIYTIGSSDRVVHVLLDPVKLAGLIKVSLFYLEEEAYE